MAQSSLRITYTTRLDVAPETEISTLANVYRFVLDCHEKRGRFLDKSGPDDAKESHGCIATEKHTR
jgi:hypothetical protein